MVVHSPSWCTISIKTQKVYNYLWLTLFLFCKYGVEALLVVTALHHGWTSLCDDLCLKLWCYYVNVMFLPSSWAMKMVTSDRADLDTYCIRRRRDGGCRLSSDSCQRPQVKTPFDTSSVWHSTSFLLCYTQVVRGHSLKLQTYGCE